MPASIIKAPGEALLECQIAFTGWKLEQPSSRDGIVDSDFAVHKILLSPEF
jgi:hypothetical protein